MCIIYIHIIKLYSSIDGQQFSTIFSILNKGSNKLWSSIITVVEYGDPGYNPWSDTVGSQDSLLLVFEIISKLSVLLCTSTSTKQGSPSLHIFPNFSCRIS